MRRRPPKSGICPPIPPSSTLVSFEDVVADYLREFQPRVDNELPWFSKAPSLAVAVERAALCRTSRDKRHPHQTRIPLASLQAAHQELSSRSLRKCKSFDELHDLVETAIHGIHRIGPLTTYDISLHIGMFLGLEPERIYLHRGTRTGAEAIGLGKGRTTLEVSELPEPFHVLKPREIEDCLCLYKSELRAITNGTSSTPRPAPERRQRKRAQPFCP